ncbi:MAG: HAD-IB family phosphatase [bacterium]|nr:HAD-IB family phosphatase [bacterium]
MESIYFIDFDNTISRHDVWDAIVKQYIPGFRERVVSQYIHGELSSRECNELLAQQLRAHEPDVRAMVMEIGVDPCFIEFAEWARAAGLPMRIVSDGYDYYIDLLMGEAGLSWIPRNSNEMRWVGDQVAVSFPHHRDECERDMANCKCGPVMRAEGKRRVYIGDGISDACAAPRCEVIYAKGGLLAECQKRGLAHHPFESFDEILRLERAWHDSFERDSAVAG